MPQEWSNWSGSLRFTPDSIETPRDERHLAELVQRAAAAGRTVRVVGAGHSSSALVKTDDVLISLERFQGLVAHDSNTHRATLRTGMTLHEAGQKLLDVNLALHNLGDVDVQTVVGAVGTGTHGSGKRLQNLAAALVGARLVTGTGDIIERTIEDDPQFFCAARCSLGALGIFTEITLQLMPAYQLRRREWCTHVDDCLAHLNELIEQNRNFDFYWYPRSDEVKLRTLNIPGRERETLPYATVVEDETGWSGDVIPKTRELKFEEMEYALPAEAGPACLREIRERVKEKHRRTVGWRVLYRTVAPDDAYLSPAHARETVTISILQNNTLPYREYFNDIEPIFRAHGGRPHWGKLHSLRAEELRPLYPMWDAFLAARQQTDPTGTFLNRYLGELLGIVKPVVMT